MRLALLLAAAGLVFGQDIQPELNVLHGVAEFAQADRMLSSYLSKLENARAVEREELLRRLRTREDVRRYQADTRAELHLAIGQIPAHTALNPKVTGTLDRAGYTVEKVIFESRPSRYVTANVFVPRRHRPPFPAVIATIGHWGAGKAHEDHQKVAAYMARRGILVVTYDVPGQGERVEHYSPIFRRTILDRGSSEYFVTTDC